MIKYILIIGLVLLAVSAHAADTKDYYYYGFPDTGSAWTGSVKFKIGDSILGTYWTCADDGVIDTFVARVLITLDNCDVKCCLYSSTTPVCSSQVVNVAGDVVEQTIHFPVSNSFRTDSNTNYTIAIWSYDGSGLEQCYYTNTGEAGPIIYKNIVDYGTWPNPASFSTLALKYTLHVYCKIDTTTITSSGQIIMISED